MKKSNDINVNKVVEKLNSGEISQIVKAVNKGDFSEKQLDNICDSFDDLILEAYKTKFSLELGFLFEKEPNLSLRNVVLKMLNMLPEDVEESHISILTQFVMEQWKIISPRLAA